MKKLLLTLLAAAVTLAAAAGGISSAAELAAFAEAVNAGGDIAAWQDERGEVHLKADIDMSGIKRFARIGNFEGVFDGEGHAILNWKTDGGLFRLVAEGSVVRNLVIAESCSMKVSDDGDDALYAGFVADVNHGILERCENYGSIAHRSARSLHDNYVGGVCGMNKYVVIRCKNGGDISSAGSCPSLAPTAEPRMYLGGVLGGAVYCWRHQVDWIDMLDVICPALFIGQSVGRMANLLNGDAFGAPTGGDFGILYPAGTLARSTYGAVPLWPAEVWEGQVDVILFALLLLFQTTKPRKGQPCCLYVMLYSLLRFSLEFLRGDYVEPMLWGLKSAQVTALVSFTVALALFVWAGMRKKPAA